MAVNSPDASGVSAQALSLPKGGGAIKGMGEKFEPDVHTGTGNFSVPLSLPPGRHNFSPQLSLAYTTGGGNGAFGLGWSLGIPNVSRKTGKGVPIYDDDQDVFILSGAEDLVEVKRERNGTRLTIFYRPRAEGLFAQVAHVVDDGQDFWQVITRGGIRSIYGNTAESRIGGIENGNDHIFAWYLVKSEDRLGNRMLYHYKRDDGPVPRERNHSYNQTYLERIEYCNYHDARINAEQYLFRIDFDYGDFDASETRTAEWPLRPDPFSSYRAGFEIRTARRCERILIRSLDPNANAPTHLIRSYDLDYVQDRLSGVSLLQSVVHRGYSTVKPGVQSRDWDSAAQTDILPHRHRNTNLYVIAFPPVSFSYSCFAPERRTIQTLSFGCDHPPEHALSDRDIELIDLYGNGLPNILHTTASGYSCWRNLGHGLFTGPRRFQSAPAGVALRDDGVQLADMQGNGSADLLVTEGSKRGFYENDFSGEWGAFHPFTEAPSFSLKDPNVRLVDLDGDGAVDVLAACAHHFLYIRNSTDGGRVKFSGPLQVERQHDLDAWPDVFFDNPEDRVRMADMSGDGLQDIVLLHGGCIDYWPNLGHCRWGRRITLLNGPHLPWRYDPKRLFLADINGDGLADLIYVDSSCVRYWINRSGNRWSDEQVIACGPPVTDFDSVRIADVNGTGTAGILWSYDWAPASHGNYLYLDFTGPDKPMLLNRIDNHIGAVTRVEYRPSTDFYVADLAAGTPWKTSLPFPVNVVSKVTVEDLITGSKLTTRYTYHHGHYDGREREYRGFGRVEQYDGETFGGGEFELPPVLTKTWFHTGAYFEAEEISRQFREEYYLESDSGEVAPAGAPPDRFRAMLLEDTVLPADLSADEAHEACRVLNGSILRQEIYALDNSAEKRRPYSVSERNYALKMLQPSSKDKCAVFFAYPRETVNFHYERKLFKTAGSSLIDPKATPQNARTAVDPRVTHTINIAVDDFGNMIQSISIGYGRRFNDPSLTPADQEKQGRTQLTYTDNKFTNAILDTTNYHAPLPCETRIFELLKVDGPPGPSDITNLFKCDQLRAIVNTPDLKQGDWDIPYQDVDHALAVGDHPYRRLVEHSKTYYRRDDLQDRLPIGVLQPLALPFETYRLAFTPEMARQVYVDCGKLTQPELDPILGDECRYVHCDDNNWWVPSGQVRYSPHKNDTVVDELDFARRHFFQPHRFLDPFGEATTVTYDTYDLLVQETRDALNNVVTAGERDQAGNLVVQGNDYRVLYPRLLMDSNRNRSMVEFDALGVVAASAVGGKPEENLGDTIADFDPALFDVAVAGCLQDPFGNPHNILQGATTRVIYDLFAYWRNRTSQQPQPAIVYTLVRETHQSDLDGGQTATIQHSFSYSDGFGREIQRKIRAEKGPVLKGGPIVDPRWVGSGWTIFNNKGRPIRQYEPFFTETHHFEFARTEGTSSVLFYDPIGRAIGVLHPNHTYEKVVFDPWCQKTFDVNDTVAADPRTDEDIQSHAGAYFGSQPADWKTWLQQQEVDPANPPADSPSLSHQQRAALRTLLHADTPAIAYFDTLGHPFLTLAHNRFRRKQDGGTVAIDERYPTRVILDIEGNECAVRDGIVQDNDALGRVVMQYHYDMLGNRIRQDSMEAGTRWRLNNVVGNPAYAWDSRNHEIRTVYDALQRRTEVRLTEGGAAAIVIERTVYGEAMGAGGNHRAKVYQVFDSAGVVTNEAYDFKGNVVRISRRLATNYRHTLNWSGAVPLEADSYSGSTSYDALNRPIALTTPDESVVNLSYNEAGLLDRVAVKLRGAVKATTFVKAIAYNAKGQRERIEYGNSTFTKYEYDEQTFRLANLKTTRTNVPLNERIVQDLSYTYDPVGNVTHIQDDADIQGTVFFRNRRVEPSSDYTYDALYRLIEATGREHLGQVGGAPLPDSYNDAPRVGVLHPGDGNALGTYVESYVYDAVGNLLEMHHQGRDPANPGWMRAYGYDEPSLLEAGKQSNRLSSTTIGNDILINEQFGYDVHGNTLRMPHLQVMQWDFKDQLRMTQRQAVNAADAEGVERQGERTWYVYDAGGKRARKITEFATGDVKDERVYLGMCEVYRKNGANPLVRETLHVMDDNQCVASVDTRVLGEEPGVPGQLTRYRFGNHLGSVSLELDDQAQIISYEEYTPYGSTSYQGIRSQTDTPKRYRYAGKERDDESGLHYYGARYCSPWLGRWISCDPAAIRTDDYLGEHPELLANQDRRTGVLTPSPLNTHSRGVSIKDVPNPNCYLLAAANPVTLVDPHGLQEAQNKQLGMPLEYIPGEWGLEVKSRTRGIYPGGPPQGPPTNSVECNARGWEWKPGPMGYDLCVNPDKFHRASLAERVASEVLSLGLLGLQIATMGSSANLGQRAGTTATAGGTGAQGWIPRPGNVAGSTRAASSPPPAPRAAKVIPIDPNNMPGNLAPLGPLPILPSRGPISPMANPFHPLLPGSKTNCLASCIAYDLTLGGPPGYRYVALPGPRVSAWEFNLVKNNFSAMPFEAVRASLVQAGPGARGIVWFEWTGGTEAHAIHAVNVGGAVVFIDAQSGELFSPSGIARSWFWRTR